jgi:hypothetical protein
VSNTSQKRVSNTSQKRVSSTSQKRYRLRLSYPRPLALEAISLLVSRVMLASRATALAVCGSLFACGGGGAMPRAKAPTAPDEQSRCHAAAVSGSPLVTEWSSAEKANLQARLRSGGLAVEFTGCSMRPITACTVRGSYRWQRTTLASEGIEIRSQDELFAKLPLGALALEGELARAGRLAVRTMVSGQYVLEGSGAADVPDYGECAAATHLLTGISMGSFKMHSGGTLEAGGGVSAGPYEGGGRTSSSETLLREAGDFDSCKASTDESPEMNCSSPIQAFLTPLPRFAKERGSGTMRVTFASGTDQAWELRQNQQFVCRTPCTRWIAPSDSYQMRQENGAVLATLDVPDLARYADGGELQVRAFPKNTSKMVGGIVAAGVGGGFLFIGGFLALAGGMSERSGLTTAGAVTAGIGAAALVPGIYLIATSGSKAEIRSNGVPIEDASYGPSPQLAIRGSL